MTNVLKSGLMVAVLALSSFAFSANAFARDLEEVMSEMGSALKVMQKDAAAPTDAGKTAAGQLKTLSIEASVMGPEGNEAVWFQFEGLLLDVAVKSNGYQQANLAKDTVKLSAAITEIRALMKQGHDLFK